MVARAQGTAAISFGLVSIPVKLYTTAQSTSAIRFNQLASDGARLKQQYISTKTGDIVPRSDMIKGYEFAKGQFVTFTPAELKALESKATHTVDIKEFVPADEVDRMISQKSYFLGPDKGGAKAYQLLSKAMIKTGQVAIAKYASRGKDYLVMIRPKDDGLIMDQLYYTHEIKDMSDVPIDSAEVSDAEVALAIQLIEQVQSEHFEHAKYDDEVRTQVLGLIERKVAGEEITIEAEDESETKIVDLMAALKASLSSSDKKPAKKVEAAKEESADEPEQAENVG